MEPSPPVDGRCRLFVAIRLAEDVCLALRTMQAELKQLLPADSISWTPPANLHLTLRFLGNVDSSRRSDLNAALTTSLARFGAVHLICERLGCFPDLRFPRVVWAGVHDTEERLVQLHRRIDGAVAPFAEKPAEMQFAGHITLGRPKRLRRLEAERLAD